MKRITLVVDAVDVGVRVAAAVHRVDDVLHAVGVRDEAAEEEVVDEEVESCRRRQAVAREQHFFTICVDFR